MRLPSFVITGLVPMISIRKALTCPHQRGRRDTRAFTPVFAGYARRSQQLIHLAHSPVGEFPIELAGLLVERAGIELAVVDPGDRRQLGEIA